MIAFFLGLGFYRLQQGPKLQDFQLYAENPDASNVEVWFDISFPAQAEPQKILGQLSELLSRLNFCRLPIEVLKFENGTATINLSEHPWYQPNEPLATNLGCANASWRSLYFQGSAGGSITTKTLVKTFLQPQQSAPWIEQVQFFYEGKPILAGDWDHIQLDGVITHQTLSF